MLRCDFAEAVEFASHHQRDPVGWGDQVRGAVAFDAGADSMKPMGFPKSGEIPGPVSTPSEGNPQGVSDRDPQRFSVERVVTVGTQDHAFDAEGGGDAKEHADVVDVTNRLADQQGRGSFCIRNEIVDRAIIDPDAIPACEDASVDRKSDDRFEDRLGCHQGLDRRVAVGGEGLFQPWAFSFGDQNPPNPFWRLEHCFHDQGLFADEDPRSCVAASLIPAPHVAEVFQPGIIGLLDRFDTHAVEGRGSRCLWQPFGRGAVRGSEIHSRHASRR